MKWRSLTQEEKQLARSLEVVNGCGPADWRWPKFNWFFEADCEEHDWNYAVGGTEDDRRRYDLGFFNAMLRDAKRLSWWQRPYARVKAQLFYTLVRLRGSSQFHYGQKRTLKELL